MSELLLVPAYGRHYDTPDALLRDWKDGKDFKICNGPYCSVRDVKRMIDDGYTHVEFHDRNFTKTIELEAP